MRRSPVTNRTPSRRLSLNATAVTAQLRSIAIALVSEYSAMARVPRVTAARSVGSAQNVPMFEKSQYQNQMISPVPPHAAT
jgi:hypothetical protein